MIEKIIEIAHVHGVDSVPDMEVGDLQAALRICWQELTDYQQQVLYHRMLSEIFGEGVTR